MEDIVAARVRDNSGKWYGFMTWGRIMDAVNESWVEEAVRHDADKCAIDGIAEVRVCPSLLEVMHCEYFHEALFHFANAGIPFGPSYEAWKRERLNEIQQGSPKVYFLGRELGAERNP
jgi:hypothetical protein